MSARFCVVLLLAFAVTATRATPQPCLEFADYLHQVNPYGQFPQLRSIVVDGTRAYAAKDGLIVLDVADPRNPVQLGSLPLTGFIETLAVSGRYAYLTHAWEGLLVVDVGDPTQPVVVGSVDFAGFAYDIAVRGPLAYVTGIGHALTTIDVSVPSQPVVRHVLAGQGKSVALAGNYAVICDSGVQIADLSIPTAPRIVGQVHPANLNGVAVAAAGHFAYVADRYYGLRIVDFADPAHPAEVGSVDFEFASENFDVVTVGNLVLVVGGGRTTVVDVSVPSAPVVIGTVETSIGAYHIAAANGLAYLPAGYGLRIIDLAHPSSPPALGTLSVPGWAVGVAVAGDIAYVANQRGVLAIDIADRTRPTVVGNLDTPDGTGALDVAGGRAYVAGYEGGVHVVDIADPGQPVLLKSVPVASSATDIQVQGRYAYVADRYYGLRVFDIAPSLVISPWGALDLPGQAWKLAVSGTTALVATSYPAAARIVDITKPGSPRLLGSFLEGENITDVLLDGNVAYVTTFVGRLLAVDLARPAYPRVLGETRISSGSQALTIHDSHLYVTGSEVVEVVDVSDPGQPRSVGVAAAHWGEAAAVAGDVLCVCRSSDGFRVLPLQCGQQPVQVKVPIDIAPGDPRNVFDCMRRDLITVAVLCGDGFDPDAIDHFSVRFGPDGAEEAHVGPWGPLRHRVDVDADGDQDLVFHFRQADTGIQCGGTKATLTGRLRDGRDFLGVDVLTPVSGADKALGEPPTLRITPNPFNPLTTIRFELAVAGPVRLSVFDLAGRLVRTLIDEELPPAVHEVAWDGRDTAGRLAASGSYVARLEHRGGMSSARLVLLR